MRKSRERAVFILIFNLSVTEACLKRALKRSSSYVSGAVMMIKDAT
jgi:hypothetical protein